MEEASVLLTPDEVKKRREKKQEIVQQTKVEKFFNRGGSVAINFETMGRFSIPDIMYFKDYTIEDVNTLALSRHDDLLENVVSIMESLKNEDANCKVSDMLIEEFLESLIGIKKQFNTTQHIHRWLCDCQSNIDENDQIVNETIIDLNEIEYKSIEEGDKLLKNYYKSVFDTMNDEDWKTYIYTKYKNNPIDNVEEYTKEKEIEKIQLTEPIQIGIDNHIYAFRLTRIADLISAQKLSAKKYASKIKNVQNRKDPNVAIYELKEKKKEEIDRLRYEQAKYTVIAAKALSLVSVDGRELTDDNEKINVYSKLPRSILIEFSHFIDQFKFGIQHEQEFACPICGKVDKRLLQQELNPIELLPLDATSSGERGKPAKLNIYIGL
jgi:hypothetical protein